MTTLPYRKSTRASGLDFSDGQGLIANAGYPSEKPKEGGSDMLQRNKTERRRLQGLMRPKSRVDAPVGPTNVKLLKLKERWDKWMVNDGGRQLFFGIWIFLHMLVIAFGFMNYQLKDNLTVARATFGLGYRESSPIVLETVTDVFILAIARTAALVLHVDVALILLPVCRSFISFLRRTALNDFIPFDKNITFHKATAWSIVFFTAVHIIAHMYNFARLAIATGNNTGERIKIFFEANVKTGPGATGWVMTILLAIMVWFAIEKRKRKNFERFWYTHHLFILFFVCWQLHGMFCMISTCIVFMDWTLADRPRQNRIREAAHSALGTTLACSGDTGSSVDVSGSMSVSCAKSAPATERTSTRSSSILARCVHW